MTKEDAWFKWAKTLVLALNETFSDLDIRQRRIGQPPFFAGWKACEHEKESQLAEAVEIIKGLMANIEDYIDNDDACILRQWRKTNEDKAREFLEKHKK